VLLIIIIKNVMSLFCVVFCPWCEGCADS
jgi:hypothetical protein